MNTSRGVQTNTNDFRCDFKGTGNDRDCWRNTCVFI